MGGRIAIFLTLFLGCSISYGEEAVEIPLSEVWTANIASRFMLTAKSLAKLESDHYGQQGSYRNSKTFQVVQTLSRDQHTKKPLRPGFVVSGDDHEALEQVHSIFVKGQSPNDRIPQGNRISAVFFTRQIGYMHLMRIERTGATITINYCLEPTGASPIVGPRVAIIPLGKLPIGKYQVNIVGFTKKLDDHKSKCEPIKDDRMKNQVCQPFEFWVVE